MIARRLQRSRGLSTILVLVVGATSVSAQERAPEAATPLGFVIENGDGRSVTADADTLRLRGSRGWLRVPKVFSDFRLKLEFRILDEQTDAGVAIRTWTGRGGWPREGYRIRLSHASKEPDRGLLEGRRQRIKPLTSVTPAWRGVGEWQSLDVVAEAEQIRVTLNDQPAGSFKIEEPHGHVLIDAQTGVVEIRAFTVQAIGQVDARPGDAISAAALRQAGGSMPRPIREVKPRYTWDAMMRKVRGSVLVEAVVLPNGTPAGVRVTRSLDRDLDEVAVAAAERWRFAPGMLNGQPVPVIVSIEMAFILQ